MSEDRLDLLREGKIQPENVIEKGSRPYFKAWQTNMKRPSVPRAVSKLREGHSFSTEERDLEMRAISTMCIEKIWANMSEWNREHGAGIVLPDKSKTVVEELKKKEITMPQDFEMQSGFTSGGLRRLFEATRYAAHYHTVRWTLGRVVELRQKPDGPDISPEARLFKRYRDILRAMNESNPQPMRNTVTTHLLSGMNTAINIPWGLVNALPSAYRRAFEKPITADQFTSCKEVNRDYTSFLSNTHGRIITALQNRLIGPVAKSDNAPFFKHLCIKQSDGAPQLDIELSGLRKISLQLYQFEWWEDDERYGCPALFAEGEKNAVVGEIHDWIFNTVGQYCLPHLEDYRRYSDEMYKTTTQGISEETERAEPDTL